MSSKTTNKGVAWLYNEVCALLDIWADQEIQQELAGRLHNMCIYEKISKKLTDLGIHRTGEQCREKIKKLRRDYKTVVDNNYSPAFARKMLGCYDKAHEIFGKCTVVKPSFVIESLIYNESFSQCKKGVETDDTGSKIIKDCLVSDYEKLKSNFNEKNAIDLPYSTNEKNDSSDTIYIDNGKQKVKTDSFDNIHINNLTGQKIKIDISNPKIKTNFKNVLETMKIKHSQEKSNWNTFRSRIERRLEKQTFLHSKILRRQAVLHNRFIELERKKFIDEMEQEKQRLTMLEIERQRHNEQEINLFKSLLQMMAEKQDVKLSLQSEDAG